MYPFERFTEDAKRALTLAQQEAERSHHSYIGTEHILLALVQQRGTVAGETLTRLGVALDVVRSRIEAVLGANERMIIQQRIPTSRVKKVIELGFDEARRAGSTFVGTQHLLLGLLIEGEGIAAHVLEEVGANLDRVRETVQVVTREGRINEIAGGPYSPTALAPAPKGMQSVSLVFALASEEAAADFEDNVTDAHLLRAVLRHRDERVLRALERLGVDAESLSASLRPPERVIELRKALRRTVDEKRSAAAREDYHAAEVAQRAEATLREELKAAEEDSTRPSDDDTQSEADTGGQA